MKKSYNEKVAIITGGARGLGASISEYFAKNNYNVVINYNYSRDKAEKLKKDLEKKYPVKVLLIQADISKEQDVIKIKDKTLETFGTITTLVNNAAICIDNFVENKTVDDFHKVLDVNLIGPFLTMKHIGKYMYDNDGESIVNISSTNGIDTYYPEGMDYDASKAGLISLNHNFAEHYAPKLRINCIAPGWIKTDMSKDLDIDYYNQEINGILLGRFAEPEEIADAVYFAATSKYLNDSIIKVDGGARR